MANGLALFETCSLCLDSYVFSHVVQWGRSFENQNEGFHFLLYCRLDILESPSHLVFDGRVCLSTKVWKTVSQ